MRELRYLVAVVDTRSFTAAAIELGVSQAAVSRAVGNLEGRLGQCLLLRTPRACEVTPLGAQLTAQARRVLAEVDRLEDLALHHHLVLRLGYAWAAVGQHTTPLLRSWSSRHPEIELQMVRHNTPTSGLIEGRADVAIVRTPVDAQQLDSVVVGLERRMVAFAADDPEWRRRRTLKMAEIAQRTVVIDPRTGTTTSGLWRDGAAPERFVRSGDVDEWLDAIAAGHGVGVTAEATAAHHSRPGVAFRPVADGPPIPVHLAWWKISPPPGLKSLIDEITRLYRSGR